jgi:hypothetical protein
MNEKRAGWKEENEQLENHFKDYKENLKRERRREGEEYNTKSRI